MTASESLGPGPALGTFSYVQPKKESEIMKPRVMVFRAALFALVCTAAWGQATAPSGVAPTQDKDRFTVGGQLRKPSNHSGLPVVGEFERTRVEAAADAEHRQKREKHYIETHFKREPFVDPGLIVNGQQETANITILDYNIVGSPDPAGIPVSGSTAIVVGTVTGGSTFITKDHTYVYTDYTVRIDQIIVPDKAATLSVGSQVTVAYEGGAIHFPSGHIKNVLIHGHGFPEIGGQYVLFLLKTVASIPEYDTTLDSGYQIKNGRVYPLDDVNSQYAGVDYAEFQGELQKAIASAREKGAMQ